MTELFRAPVGGPEQMARQLLRTCGPGRMLVVGDGAGTLVRALLLQGADVYEAHSSGTADRPAFALGRTLSGTLPTLDSVDASFDSVVGMHCLEKLPTEQVAAALRELYRVCARDLVLYVAAAGAPPRAGQRTIASRDWWETAAFAAGFRKHPLYYEATPYETLEAESGDIVISLRKIDLAVLLRYPLEALLDHRELHMDMSRETGRRSDAHMARYQLAAAFVRAGDAVLDAACGLGYGSYMLAFGGAASHVMGADLDEHSIGYAADHYADLLDRLTFRCADVQDLAFLPDNSLDLFVSFETLEHVPHPRRLIAEARRILRPGGRFIASVPNQWVNEHGVDPNPYHLHVYDWPRLREEIEAEFLLEAGFAQTAGGGMKLPHHPRAFVEFDPQDTPIADAEWYLAVGMKDPVGSEETPYRESALRWEGEPPNIAAFGRDYDNPWLVRSLVSIGWRNRNPNQRSDLARRVLAGAAPGSADAGAALCVLAYGLLESSEGLTPHSAARLSSQIRAYTDRGDPRPICRRWVISLLYVEGLLWLAAGDTEQARDRFEQCAARDPLAYSPLLATKTVQACLLAGRLHFQVGNLAGARECWTRGITLAHSAMQGDWREVHGDLLTPFPFGLREATEVLDSAARCAEALDHLSAHASGRGLPAGASHLARLQAMNDQLAWLMTQLHAERSSVPGRLRRALDSRPRGWRRHLRVVYLLGLMLLPVRLKSALKPLAAFLRRRLG